MKGVGSGRVEAKMKGGQERNEFLQRPSNSVEVHLQKFYCPARAPNFLFPPPLFAFFRRLLNPPALFHAPLFPQEQWYTRSILEPRGKRKKKLLSRDLKRARSLDPKIGTISLKTISHLPPSFLRSVQMTLSRVCRDVR